MNSLLEEAIVVFVVMKNLFLLLYIHKNSILSFVYALQFCHIRLSNVKARHFTREASFLGKHYYVTFLFLYVICKLVVLHGYRLCACHQSFLACSHAMKKTFALLLM
jgi:hypothetical protein